MLKKNDIYNGRNGMTYVRTDAGGIALTDEVKKLYGAEPGGLDAQYAAAIGGQSDTSASLIEQYSSALKEAETARTNSALASLLSAAEASEGEYDAAAKQLYSRKVLSERAMANNLTSAGLYNSGYSDSARIALENSYASDLAESERARKAAAEKYRLAGIDLLGELSASNAETDALAAQMALEQMNRDRDHQLEIRKYDDSRADKERDYALELQKYADSRADVDRDYALELQKYNDARLDAAWNREQAEKAYADTRADIEYERTQMLAQAQNEKMQQDIKNAYAAAEMGDFSLLEKLGIDTSSAKAAYNAELELIVLKLAEAKKAAESSSGSVTVNGNTGSSSVKNSGQSTGKTESGKTASGTKTETEKDDAFEIEFATDMANKLVANMKAQDKSYSEVLDYIGSIRNGIIKQFGNTVWDKYVEVISKSYPGGSGYSEPQHLSSMESVMAFIKDSRNASRFFTDNGYNLNAIRELINNADLSESERRELRAYYGIGTTAKKGNVGIM